MNEGSIVGTPTFMAPEQARGEKGKVGPKSDQYSVGVLLYSMLCGRTPYSGETWSVVSQVANPVSAPENPRKIRKDIPRDLEACCLRAMEKDPERRYANLNELADDLNNWLEGRPLLARPIGVRERFVRWCSRNRAIASLLGIITALILTALVVGYVLAFKFRNLADYANERAIAATEAKREVERVLIDTLTESGLDAGRNGRNQEAVLWFGSAAALSSEHPYRERMNRARFHNWMKRTPIPVRMFRGLGHWHKSIQVHPRGQYVMSQQRVSEGDSCRIWHVASGELWEIPWDATIGAAVWDSQGARLAVSSSAEVRIYDFPSGEEIDRWSHRDYIEKLTFNRDSTRIAFGAAYSAGIRELAGEKRTWSFDTPQPAIALALNPTETRLAALSRDQKVRVFNVDPDDDILDPGSGSLIQPLECGWESQPPKIGFVDDNLLVVPESRKRIACWDLESEEVVWEIPCTHDPSFALSPDGERLAVINNDVVIQVQRTTGQQIGEPLEHDNTVYDVSYDASGTKILAGCGNQYAYLYSAETGQLIHSMRHGDIVHRVAWFPDSKSCMTVHWSADLIRIWRFGDSTAGGFSQDLPAGVMHVNWSDDGRYFLPSGMDWYRGKGPYHAMRVDRDGVTDETIPFRGHVSDTCFLPGTTTVIVGGSAEAATGPESHKRSRQDLNKPGLIVASDIVSGKQVFPEIKTDSNVIAVAASPYGDVIAALCHDHQLLMIDASSGEVLHQHKALADRDFFYGFVIYRRLAFSPDGSKLAVWGVRSRKAELRDGSSGELLREISHAQPSNVNWLHNVAFSPDGKTLATCSADQTVQLWNTETGEQVCEPLQHTGWVFAAVFSEDGKRLLTACRDYQARLWDLDAPARPVIVTPAQSDEIYGICFLPGDEIFLVGLRDGEVSAWDCRQGKMIAPPDKQPDQDAVYSLSVSPDQSQVVIISRDPKVRGYPVSRWQGGVDRRFTSAELQMLGEMIASQHVQDGVMAGLPNPLVMNRWLQLYGTHAGEPIFTWPTSDRSAAENVPGASESAGTSEPGNHDSQSNTDSQSNPDSPSTESPGTTKDKTNSA